MCGVCVCAYVCVHVSVCAYTFSCVLKYEYFTMCVRVSVCMCGCAYMLIVVDNISQLFTNLSWKIDKSE